MNPRYYINVKELMARQLPRPRLRRTVLVCDGEWLPLIKINMPEAVDGEWSQEVK